MGATVPVPVLYAALLTLLFLVLSIRVIRYRQTSGIVIGVAGNSTLERAARVHANFAEYVPFVLLLMLLTELSGYRAGIVHTAGVLLVAGRSVHAWGVSRDPEDYRLRVVGMALTFTVMAVLALLLLVAAVARMA